VSVAATEPMLATPTVADFQDVVSQADPIRRRANRRRNSAGTSASSVIFDFTTTAPNQLRDQNA
jgi:hypothetical protein